ncbi:S8 family serine peptidase [Halococcus sp. AFM35]|uniref:S8 family serine peptidase n=1 Tax=Halococcus sp. AFM35 TaxID=3421653 RepID=UPI003EC0FE5F
MPKTSSFSRREFLKVAGTIGILSGAADTAVAQQSDRRRNELLVGVDPSTNARRTAQRALPSEARIVSENDTLGYVRAELPERISTSATASVTSTVASRRGVEYAEPNAVYETLAVPNDPHFGDQYAPEMVNAPAAWNTTYGDGEVTIAVVDQGVKYDHPDLEANVASDRGRNLVDDDDDPYPNSLADEHHGTHVAGIASAGTDNDTGIAGISNATLLGVRALNESGSGTTADIADGIQWAADNGADIINLSFGGGGFTETLQKAVSYAHEEGVLLVAAAGNSGGSVSYPAAYDECVAVSALDPDGGLASYSSRGPEIELTAPGTNVLSTWTDDGYNLLSGTSMAAPVVSGVAALVLSQKNLTKGELRSRLKNAAIDVGLSSEEQGSGRIDAAVAMNDDTSTLRIDGTGSRTDYSFSVSGDLEGVSLTGEDDISGSTATGAVGSGRDSYRFTGELIAFSLDGKANVTLDGEPALIDQYPDHALVIDGAGSRTDYSFTVSGDLEGASLTGEDSITGSSATGAVGGGHDSYGFSGELIAFDLDGEANVTVDGRPARVGQRSDHALVIDGAGSRTEYSFSVSGDLEGASLTKEDDISGSTATGAVGGGQDSYGFTGDLRTLNLDGNATVRLDGAVIDLAQYEKILTIESSGSYVSYDVTVSGTLRADAGITGEDDISGSSATGAVSGGRDTYAFSGAVTSLSIDSERTAPTDSLPYTLTIAGTGSHATYDLTVSGDLEPHTGITGEDDISGSSATGAVSGGHDTYAFSGNVSEMTFTGDVAVHITEFSPPTIGIHNGLSDSNFDTINRMEEWQNTDYAVQNLFVPWNPDEGHMNWLFDQILPQIWNSGRTPLITWEPYTPGARTASVDTQSLVERNEYDAYLESLADTTPDDIEVRIQNGEYDGYIDRWANRLQNALAGSSDRQAYLRLAHEMNGDWYPWSPTVGDSTPGSYIEMWRHVHNRFDRQGLGGDDLQWMWCVNAEDVGSYRAEQLYPGNRYVDWLSLDGYQWGRSQSWSSWQSPDSIYGEMLDRLAGLGDKPVCVAEFASSSKVSVGYDPQRKDAWIRDALAYFENRGVDMWCWFNEDKETDWAVFNGVRGTETVAHDGTQVNAYSAYRETVDTYGSTANTTATESVSSGQTMSDD